MAKFVINQHGTHDYVFPAPFPDSFDRLARQPPPPTHGQTHKHARIQFFLSLKIHKVVVRSPSRTVYTHFLSFNCQPFGIAVAHLAAMIIHFISSKAIEIESQSPVMK